MKRTALAFLTTLALATSAAHAVEYNQVQADKSQIAFGYQQMGVSMEGSFKTFSSQLRFDPAAPQAAAASIEVELASVDTGSAEGDGEVARKTWFNTKDFPAAPFQSSAVKALGGNNYEVAGTLTINLCSPGKCQRNESLTSTPLKLDVKRLWLSRVVCTTTSNLSFSPRNFPAPMYGPDARRSAGKSASVTRSSAWKRA